MSNYHMINLTFKTIFKSILWKELLPLPFAWRCLQWRRLAPCRASVPARAAKATTSFELDQVATPIRKLRLKQEIKLIESTAINFNYVIARLIYIKISCEKRLLLNPRWLNYFKFCFNIRQIYASKQFS